MFGISVIKRISVTHSLIVYALFFMILVFRYKMNILIFLPSLG